MASLTSICLLLCMVIVLECQKSSYNVEILLIIDGKSDGLICICRGITLWLFWEVSVSKDSESHDQFSGL